MALNPITYNEHVAAGFLRYQLAAYPFADADLLAQMRQLLSLAETRATPLLKGPYISLARAFRMGPDVASLTAEGLLHPRVAQLVPYPQLYGHQDRAIRAIAGGRPTLISTGTGSGKTECFLYPIISRCLQLRDEQAAPGIIAVLVYPMNALAEDQLLRLRGLLAGSGIPFGMYVGHTPDKTADVSGQRLPAASSRVDYERALEKARAEGRAVAVHPPEERVSREQMRAPGGQPRILLTNVKQLELLLTRHADIELFTNVQLEMLVFDEAHTFSGAAGAETACLIRRLRAFCGPAARGTVCVGTSATLADPAGDLGPAREFGARFFGADVDAVDVVREEYQDEDWSPRRVTYPAPTGRPADHLERILQAIAEPAVDGANVVAAFQSLTGDHLAASPWEQGLYDRLAASELCYQIARVLTEPVALDDLSQRMGKIAGRTVSSEEILCWLALGAASRRAGRPLLRPVVHAFVRGVGGAVVTFPEDRSTARLWLSAEQQAQQVGGDNAAAHVRLPVTTCTTCGQHYFVHFVEDLTFKEKGPAGGRAIDDRAFWPALDVAQGGQRVVLLDRLLGEEEDDEDPARLHRVHLCRWCGALHPAALDRCDGCGRVGPLVALRAVQFTEDNPGWLRSCVSCKAPARARGSRVIEPAREVRATAVSDVHVLAQSMLHHADRKRLLIFSDNRQDAAFQAGWMRDHARRFRLRALIDERLQQGPVSIGDLSQWLDGSMERDDALSRSLLPEVWIYARKEAAGQEHARVRREFLRVQVLREIATGLKQRFGLEPWGRLKVGYLGLTPELPFVTRWAAPMGVEPARLCDGIAALLDLHRRKMLLLDREGQIFTHYWQEGDAYVQRGFLPLLKGVPKGVKLQREGDDTDRWLDQWLSARGDTTVRHALRNWGLDKEQAETFARELWELLCEPPLALLVPVVLLGAKGNALPRAHGARQIDGDKLLLHAHRGRWACQKCQRSQIRPTPNDRCIAFRCDGTLAWRDENPEDYDIAALNERLTMVRPEEHSAQVHPADRERVEQLFKNESSDSVNTLVCTPTLEMGVDIGALDTVMLRNVPPLPANYWQRVGRAGRRHRLAVNITYCRPTTHDQGYFADPLKLLQGRVEPPRFNLSNELMVAKHVHAATLTHLHGLARPDSPLEPREREEIATALSEAFPVWVKGYLFREDGTLRTEPFQAALLDAVIARHRVRLEEAVTQAFHDHWPAGDAAVVAPDRLSATVTSTARALESCVARVRARLDYALRQMERLDGERRSKGTLDADEDALYRRCDGLVKRLKGAQSRERREAEGYDDTYTYSMLAAEGFLPGYGLESGAVVGFASAPKHLIRARDLNLPRPMAVAVREYVPGNLIYANGNKFTPRYFHLTEQDDRELFQVDLENEAVKPAGAPSPGAFARLGETGLLGVPICDVDLAYQSQITDDEEFRFQMGVSVYGYDREQHNGGALYHWGPAGSGARDLKFLRGLRLRLVNVGPTSQVERRKLGYPLSLVDGQSRSPFASDMELEYFDKQQLERHGKSPARVAFFADVVADCLILTECRDRTEAYSLAEALRLGMRQTLEMETEDLQVLVVARVGGEGCDAYLYDPMAGGSGLLQQALERWPAVCAAALAVTQGCPAECATSCPECLRTFRNQYYHKYLDRHLAVERLGERGARAELGHEIPESVADRDDDRDEITVNIAEQILRGLLERASITGGVWQKQLKLGLPLGTTTPDVYFELDPDEATGVCVYLDGLSAHIHGNPATRLRDQQIRAQLRSLGHEVIEIAASDLFDRDAMDRHFRKIVRWLKGKEGVEEFKANQTWYDLPTPLHLKVADAPTLPPDPDPT